VGEEKKACIRELRELAKEIGLAENKSWTLIIGYQTLNNIAAQMPITANDMINIDGVGQVRFNKYGEKLLEITKKYPPPMFSPAGIHELSMNSSGFKRKGKRRRKKGGFKGRGKGKFGS